VGPSSNNVPPFYQIPKRKTTETSRIPDSKNFSISVAEPKQVNIELLATLMPYPIQFESRRRSLQRFLKLDCLNIESLWFPLVKEILQANFQKSKPLKLAIELFGRRSAPKNRTMLK
jgi:hypothetical protein